MIEKGNNQPSKSEDCFPLMVVMELNLSTNNILFIDVLEKDIRYAISTGTKKSFSLGLSIAKMTLCRALVQAT